jgi:hypothetical protein
VFAFKATWYQPQQLQCILTVAAFNDNVCDGMLHVTVSCDMHT